MKIRIFFIYFFGRRDENIDIKKCDNFSKRRSSIIEQTGSENSDKYPRMLSTRRHRYSLISHTYKDHTQNPEE